MPRIFAIRPSREVLEDLYFVQRLTGSELVQRFRCSKDTLRKWFRQYGLAFRPKSSDMTGQKRGLLTVQEKLRCDSRGALWLCRCECGNERIVNTSALARTKDCGAEEHRRGVNHHGWRGGRWIEQNGYVKINVDNRYMAEHRHVMEQMLGRPLHPYENVHHKNGVRDDNRPENLELWVKAQPCGQRVPDIVAHAVETLRRYAPDRLRESLDTAS
jgi:hypothetical protein